MNRHAGFARLTSGERGSWSRLLVAHWAWIVLITLAVTAGAAVLTEMQTPLYRSHAEVAVYPVSASSSSMQPIIMGTEKGIASSGAVLFIASQALAIPQSRLARGLSITVPVDTDLLDIAFSDPNPSVAQNVAEEVAQAYVLYRRSSRVPPFASGNTPAAAAVQTSIVTDAGFPTSPVSPNRALNLGVGLVLGLALGLGVAWLRDQLDDRLRGALDLQSQADASVLARIPAFRRPRRGMRQGLVVVTNPISPIADSYRDLRTRVLQAAAWRNSNALIVTSPGREAKSTVAANLAAALAMTGRSVILVGADLRWGQTDALLGLENRFGLTSVLGSDATLAMALRFTAVHGLQVLTSGPPSLDPSDLPQSPGFRKLLAELRSRVDFVVIDAPPVLASADTAALSELGAMILLVADARVTTRAEVRAAHRDLGHVRDDLIGWVLDNVGPLRRLPESSSSAVRTNDGMGAIPSPEESVSRLSEPVSQRGQVSS